MTRVALDKLRLIYCMLCMGVAADSTGLQASAPQRGYVRLTHVWSATYRAPGVTGLALYSGNLMVLSGNMLQSHISTYTTSAGTLKSISAVNGFLTCAAYSADNEYVVAGTRKGIMLLRLGAQRPTLVAARSGPLTTSIGISQDGSRVVCGGFGALAVWRMPKLALVKRFSRFGYSLQAALSPDGKWLAASFRRGNVKVFSTNSYSERFATTVGKEDVALFTWSPDSRYLAICATGLTKDGETCTVMRALRVPLWETVRNIQCMGAALEINVGPGGRGIELVTADGIVRAWSLATGHLEMSGSIGTGARAVVFDESGGNLYVGRYNGALERYSITADGRSPPLRYHAERVWDRMRRHVAEGIRDGQWWPAARCPTMGAATHWAALNREALGQTTYSARQEGSLSWGNNTAKML